MRRGSPQCVLREVGVPWIVLYVKNFHTISTNKSARSDHSPAGSCGNLQVERRTMAQLAFRPGSPAHAFHCLAYYRQTNTGTGIILRHVEPLKDVEDAVVVLHVEPDAVIPHPQQTALAAFLRADFNAWCGDLAGELNSIVQIVSN